MPIDVTWNPDRELWTLAVECDFTLAELTALIEKRDWHGATRFLWDLRDARTGPNATADLRRVVDMIASARDAWRGTRVGILVERDFGFAIARMFQAYADGLAIEFEVFRDAETATAWLTTRPPPNAD